MAGGCLGSTSDANAMECCQPHPPPASRPNHVRTGTGDEVRFNDPKMTPSPLLLPQLQQPPPPLPPCCLLVSGVVKSWVSRNHSCRRAAADVSLSN